MEYNRWDFSGSVFSDLFRDIKILLLGTKPAAPDPHPNFPYPHERTCDKWRHNLEDRDPIWYGTLRTTTGRYEIRQYYRWHEAAALSHYISPLPRTKPLPWDKGE